VGPRAGLDVFKSKKLSCPRQDSNHGSSIPHCYSPLRYYVSRLWHLNSNWFLNLRYPLTHSGPTASRGRHWRVNIKSLTERLPEQVSAHSSHFAWNSCIMILKKFNSYPSENTLHLMHGEVLMAVITTISWRFGKSHLILYQITRRHPIRRTSSHRVSTTGPYLLTYTEIIAVLRTIGKP
jgi:hypothetical protein